MKFLEDVYFSKQLFTEVVGRTEKVSGTTHNVVLFISTLYIIQKATGH